MPATYGTSAYGAATYGGAGQTAFGSAVARMQAMLPVAVWGDASSTSYAQAVALCLGLEIQQTWEAIAWIVQQAYPATADENGLAYWEQLLGLPIAPAGWATEDRRSAVLARRRAAGPVQLPSIAALIGQYQHGAVSLNWNAPGATLTVTWTDILGVPPHIADVQAALQAYLPAWIAIDYAYRYTTWDQVTGTGRTWTQITADALTWDQLTVANPSSL